jgi:DNA polymerase-3 subunit epsilon
MNNNNKKSFRDFDLAFIDTETTGLNLNSELIEIGLVRVSAFNFSILEEWEAKIKPKHLELADPEALKINHYNENDWANAIDCEAALKIFLEKSENTILVGHNLSFDWFYIHKSLLEYNLKPTFWYKSLDTFCLAWEKLRNNPNFKSLGLTELASYFGIKPEKLHSALDDARTTYKVFLKLLES